MFRRRSGGKPSGEEASTLQFAVQQGVRFGVVSRQTDVAAHKEAIKRAVQANALGLLNDKADLIDVKWYDQSDLSTPLPEATGANGAERIIEVSVTNFQLVPLVPVFRDFKPFIYSARSSDRMEP
jgi:hypothetical protein